MARLQSMRILLVGLVMLGSACTSTPISHGCDGPARDHVMLVDRLRCAGIRVEIGEGVTLPVIRPTGTRLQLSGGGVSGQAELDSFNYDDTDLGTDGRAVSAADAGKFAPDGSIRDGSYRVFYHGTPHLFRQERVLVIYSGEDRVVIEVLTRLVGKQFAGG
jgi:hypothetical protein